jgi:octaprenyl-diphosphate synthase
MTLSIARDALLDVADRHGAGRVRERLTHLADDLADDVVAVEGLLPTLLQGPPDLANRAAAHLLLGGGKRVRPTLCLLAARVEGGQPGPGARKLAAVAEAIHAATLLHDDVIDLGDTRRDRPAARLVFGNAASVLGGDLLLVRALELVDEAGVPELMGLVLLVLRRMVAAEAQQLARRGRTDIAPEDYFSVVDGKTASLFEWAVEAGARASGAAEATVAALRTFGGNVGVAFQMLDDLLDLGRDPDAIGKAVLQDVRGGSVTWPVLLGLRARPELAPRLEAASLGQDDPTLARDVLEAIAAAGGTRLARQEVERRTELAMAALDSLDPTPARLALGTVARGLLERSR